MENSKNTTWKKALVICLIIVGVLIAGGCLFLMFADFHFVALLFQLFIPILFMEFLPILLVIGGLIIVLLLISSSKKDQ
ncbi:hypothetical protein [Butyrivibrio sp. VCB2006]|uniref:hypothetical protein n=1 Tax=Butyrivibrio sp. VCB2006 TaxID=1280679 RepID=UPI0004926F54|nr:hypothetical protein [Butyrivibrio sp. VCB2006]